MTDKKFLRVTLLLGLTSFLTDTSSEMIMPILPFFISALGGTGLVIGLVGGLEESVSSILKVIAGYWSDKTGKRKMLCYWNNGLLEGLFQLWHSNGKLKLECNWEDGKRMGKII